MGGWMGIQWNIRLEDTFLCREFGGSNVLVQESLGHVFFSEFPLLILEVSLYLALSVVCGHVGLAKKRALLGVGEAPTLSQLLTEAKAEVVVGEVDSAPCPLSYSRLFDDYHGGLGTL